MIRALIVLVLVAAGCTAPSQTQSEAEPILRAFEAVFDVEYETVDSITRYDVTLTFDAALPVLDRWGNMSEAYSLQYREGLSAPYQYYLDGNFRIIQGRTTGTSYSGEPYTDLNFYRAYDVAPFYLFLPRLIEGDQVTTYVNQIPQNFTVQGRQHLNITPDWGYPELKQFTISFDGDIPTNLHIESEGKGIYSRLVVTLKDVQYRANLKPIDAVLPDTAKRELGMSIEDYIGLEWDPYQSNIPWREFTQYLPEGRLEGCNVRLWFGAGNNNFLAPDQSWSQSLQWRSTNGSLFYGDIFYRDGVLSRALYPNPWDFDERSYAGTKCNPAPVHYGNSLEHFWNRTIDYHFSGGRVCNYATFIYHPQGAPEGRATAEFPMYYDGGGLAQPSSYPAYYIWYSVYDGAFDRLRLNEADMSYLESGADPGEREVLLTFPYYSVTGAPKCPTDQPLGDPLPQALESMVALSPLRTIERAQI